MVLKPIQLLDGVHTTADDSVVGEAAATIAALALSNYYIQYVNRGLDSYLGKVSPLVKIVRDGLWMDQTNGVEDGESSFKFGASEFEKPSHGQVTAGHHAEVKPERILVGTLLSTTELVRERKISDQRFNILLQEKKTKPGRDTVNGMIKLFLTEVLGKIDDATGNYVGPDGKAAIADDHDYVSGATGFDNKLDITNADADVRVEEFLAGVRAYSNNTVDSANMPVSMSLDTYFVAAGSANEESLKRSLGQTSAITEVGSDDVQRLFSTETNLYPVTTNQINVFTAGSATIISVKQMPEDLIFVLDKSKAPVYELRITQDLTKLREVPSASGAIEIPFEAWMNFWQPYVVQTLFGGRLKAA